MIKYVKGNCLYATGPVLIPHICNDIGKWGAGFVVAINQRSLEPKRKFVSKFLDGLLRLGNVDFIDIGDGYIANMIAQKNIHNMVIKFPNGDEEIIPPIRYDSLKECMHKVAVFALSKNLEIHCPKFGSGLAGGDWDIIEGMIEDCWISRNIPVTCYIFE